jgi:small GTP-binding protein
VPGGWIVGIEFASDGGTLACASGNQIMIWDADNEKLIRVIEDHTQPIQGIVSSRDGQLLVSKGTDSRVNIWRRDNWDLVARIQVPTSHYWLPGLDFHPHFPLLATVGSDLGTPETEHDRVIHIWELDLAVLLGQAAAPAVTYTSAKIVLLGDSGVGKTGLGWRLAHNEFKEHASTHGQQFWLMKQLCKQRNDGTQCEAVLWDLAGQDDYRLIHALFLDDADMALVLFDPTRNNDPLSGVDFWLKQLKVEAIPPSGTPTVLIAARSDRGTPRLTQEELDAFCKQRGVKAYLSTSAKEGEGIEKLILQMQDLIPWDAKPATVTNETFKRIKVFVLNLKEDSRRRKVILTSEELRRRLQKTDRKWKFSNDEMLTAVGHLANHGYVTRLKTSQGEQRILLAPELLNNLAASFVLEARRNQKGLGSLEEQRLLSGGYKFPELEKLTEAEKDILLDSAAVLFLEHNVCFRETDPLNGRAYLVFPELINLKKPLIAYDAITEDSVAYTVSGPMENVYASLVVLMGYTQTFTRTNQWRNHARYEVGTGHVCGFRLEAEREGELDFVLYFGTNTDALVRKLFQSLFENFLARHNLTVQRFEPVECSNGHTLDRSVVRKKMSSGVDFAFCNDCAEKIMLPKAGQPIQLTKRQAAEFEANRRAADQRSRFEQVLFRLNNYVTEQKIAVPECFISYAWGDPEHERWVERSLATDLQKAGIIVVLDRWENARIGASVTRFVERVGKTDRVIVVGTPLYRKKYDNNEPLSSFVVAAEGDLIVKRMIGTETKKESVLPVLLEGTEDSAFPLLVQGRVYADFRKPESYFDKALELILSVYQISPRHPVAMELRETLMGQRES